MKPEVCGACLLHQTQYPESIVGQCQYWKSRKPITEEGCHDGVVSNAYESIHYLNMDLWNDIGDYYGDNNKGIERIRNIAIGLCNGENGGVKKRKWPLVVRLYLSKFLRAWHCRNAWQVYGVSDTELGFPTHAEYLHNYQHGDVDSFIAQNFYAIDDIYNDRTSQSIAVELVHMDTGRTKWIWNPKFNIENWQRKRILNKHLMRKNR